MNLQEWRSRRSEGEEAELPSGLTVRLRQVSVFDLAEQGEIPTTLQTTWAALMTKAQSGGVDMKDFLQFGPVMGLVVNACLVGPEGLRGEELPYTDRLAIFQWANELGRDLSFFREEEGEPVGVG